MTATMSRRAFAGTAIGALALPARADECVLPPPFEAILLRRRSTRAFAERPVEAGLRDRLLWAAQGVNRPGTGLRTTPSWRGAADARLFVADGAGVGLYDPDAGRVAPVLDRDIRDQLSPEPFVAAAPLCLLHVSDLARLSAAGGAGAERALWAHVDAAVVAQTIYLFCASEDLGTCLVADVDREAVAEALSLGPDRLVTFVQPVGWPAGAPA